MSDTVKAGEDAPIGSGIYAILNLNNGRLYVGSTGNFRKRWSAHCAKLRSGKHPNRYLQFAWLKNAAAAFFFVILERCELSDLLGREQFWIDKLGACDRLSGYNLQRLARSNKRGVKESAEATAAKRVRQLGRLQSPESNAKRSATQRGRTLPAAWCEAISRGKTGRARPDVRDWSAKKFRKFNDDQVAEIRRRYIAGATMSVLAGDLGCTLSTVCRIVKGKGAAYCANGDLSRPRGGDHRAVRQSQEPKIV